MSFGGGRSGGVDHPYGTHGRERDEKRGAAVFAVVRSWAAGIVTLLVGQLLVNQTVAEYLVTAERVESFGWRAVMFHLPNALCVALAVLAAARLHREPFRESPVQHLTAALTVPLVAYGASLLMLGSLADVTAEGIIMSSAATLVGCGAAMAADLSMDSRD